MGHIDGHCHLADKRLQGDLNQIIQRAKEKSITDFIQGGVGPEDWVQQLALKKSHNSIHCCFGLHPYWIIDHDDNQCNEALEILKTKLSDAVALGELGLDFRPQIVKGSEVRQLIFFKRQLELAQKNQKPMVFHFVNAHKQALEVLNFAKTKELKGMIHSFNGSKPQAEEYLDLGLYISVGAPVCRADNQRLHQAVLHIPLEKLCLETDSPDQPPPGLKQNEPTTLVLVAEVIAKIKGVASKEVLNISDQNLRKLFGIDSAISPR